MFPRLAAGDSYVAAASGEEPSSEAFLPAGEKGWFSLAGRGAARHRVGIALSLTRVTAVIAEGGFRGVRPVALCSRKLEPPEDQSWVGLTDALQELRERIRCPDGYRLDIAVLPPRSRTKVLELPSLGRSDLRRLIAQNAGRFFLDPPDGDVVGDAMPLELSLGRAPRACLAVASSREFVQVALDAVRTAGFQPGLVTSGLCGLIEAVCEVHPAAARGDLLVRIEGGEGWGSVVLLQRRRLRLALRADGSTEGPAPAGIRRVLEASGFRVPEATVVVSDVDVRGVSERGQRTCVPNTSLALGPDGLAAFGAVLLREDAPTLQNGMALRRWRRRLRRRAVGLVAAALLLLMAAAGVRMWALDRELAATTDRRAGMASRVEDALRVRRAARKLSEAVSSMSRLASNAPPSSGRILAEISEALPPSAFLTSLLADRGEVSITGRAETPSGLVPRLRESKLISDASLTSTHRESGGSDLQSFEVSLTLVGSDDGGSSSSEARSSGPGR